MFYLTKISIMFFSKSLNYACMQAGSSPVCATIISHTLTVGVGEGGSSILEGLEVGMHGPDELEAADMKDCSSTLNQPLPCASCHSTAGCNQSACLRNPQLCWASLAGEAFPHCSHPTPLGAQCNLFSGGLSQPGVWGTLAGSIGGGGSCSCARVLPARG